MHEYFREKQEKMMEFKQISMQIREDMGVIDKVQESLFPYKGSNDLFNKSVDKTNNDSLTVISSV